MALFDHAVIPKDKDAVPRLERFFDDFGAPCEIRAGDRLGVVQVSDWTHEGDHLRMGVTVNGDAVPFAVLLRPHDEDSAAFFRTNAWNVSYRGEAFDRRMEALLREVGKRLQTVTATRGWSVDELFSRYFVRPGQEKYLEVSPGKKLYIRVTDQCDENCMFCNATEGNANLVTSKSALRDILKRLPAGSLSQVIFSGGEPTLVKDLPDFVRLAWERGADEIIVQTNGIRFGEPGALEPYLPYRERLGLGFSLHAADPHISDMMTGALDVPDKPLAQRFSIDGKGPSLPPRAVLASGPATERHARKVRAIDLAAEMGFRIKVTAVVMRPSLAHLPAFGRWCWDRWGGALERLQFSYPIPRGHAWSHHALLPSFTECLTPFVGAFEMGRETGLRVESSQCCALPPCVAPDYIDHYDLMGDYTGTLADPERVKPKETCDGCAFDNLCPGVWTRYIDVHGTSELKAVTDRPRPDLRVDDYTNGEILDLDCCSGP